MSNMTDETLAEFGNSIDVRPLALRPDGTLTLLLGGVHKLIFQAADEAMLMMVARSPTPGNGPSTYRRALRLCSDIHGAPYPLQAGLTRDGDLLLIAHIPGRQFTLTVIDQTLNRMLTLHEQVNLSTAGTTS